MAVIGLVHTPKAIARLDRTLDPNTDGERGGGLARVSPSRVVLVLL